MGRTLRRVALDFDWPLKKVWNGYLNPHYKPCPEDGVACFNGYTAAGKWLESVCRLMSMLAEEAFEAPRAAEFKERGRSYPHPYLVEWGMAPTTELSREEIKKLRDMPTETAIDRATKNAAMMRTYQEHPPKILPLTSELQTFIEALADDKARGMMGGGFSYSLSKRLQGFAGVDPDTWGLCPACKGHGHDVAFQEAIDAWKPTEPPEGPGFQLWETTSEGSPSSPVFKTIEELCDWCAISATVFGPEKATAEEWREMLDADFVRVEKVLPDGTKMVFT